MHGNRHYALAINLAEAGLREGIPFPLYVELETDPLKDEQDKFVKRQYLGELGNEQQPVWFVINKQ